MFFFFPASNRMFFLVFPLAHVVVVTFSQSTPLRIGNSEIRRTDSIYLRK